MGNLGFWILNLLIGGFFAAPDAGVRLELLAVWGLAFPSWPIADAALSLVAGFLLLDLLHYLVHRLEHAVPFFWRIHALPHSDPDVDVTTAVRHHPVEILFTSATYWLAVLVLDVPAFIALGHGLAVFRHSRCPARQCSLTRAVGAMAATDAGRDGPSPYPPFHLIRPSELELWCGSLLLGPPLRHLSLRYAGAA
jgi:hypothetical protein